MKTINAKCPCCGNTLPISEKERIDLSKPKIHCRSCGKEILIEAAIAYAEKVSRVTIRPRNPDFVICAGELKEYKGETGNVTIPEGVVSIGESAFEGKKIRSVIIPRTVRRIEDSAFKDCDCLDYVKIMSTIVYSAPSAFEGTPYQWMKKNRCPFCGGFLTLGWIFPKTCICCWHKRDDYPLHNQ